MLIRTSDLEAAGFTLADMRARVRRGEARVVRPGTWTLDNEPALPEERHRELLEATFPRLTPGAMVCHASAGALHGLPLPASALRRVHVARPGEGGKIGRFVHLHRSAPPAEDLTEIDAFPVTSLLATTVDLARTLPPMDALAVVDAALRRGLDRADALDRVAPARRRPGSAGARVALTHGDGLAESAGESWSRWRMIEFGMPLPRLQLPLVDGDGTVVARPDFTWDDIGLVGEFDGFIKYGRLLQPGQSVTDVLLAEKAREARMRRLGWWTVRWTAADLHPAESFRALLREAWRNAPRAA